MQIHRQDDFYVVIKHLGIDRCRALILAVDEFRGTVRHKVAAECRTAKRVDNLRPIGAGGALDRVGKQQNARIIHVDFVGIKLSRVLDLLLERQRLRILRIEPMIAIHDISRGFREFLDEFV